MNKEETYQALKKRIINEELVPGQWLVERDIWLESQIWRRLLGFSKLERPLRIRQQDFAISK